ncbi:MAG: hypothetical protein N2545_01145 [Thermoflexales bacterium]|nr:hypothetical protein [Thermoflexales bacterium]
MSHAISKIACAATAAHLYYHVSQSLTARTLIDQRARILELLHEQKKMPLCATLVIGSRKRTANDQGGHWQYVARALEKAIGERDHEAERRARLWAVAFPETLAAVKRLQEASDAEQLRAAMNAAMEAIRQEWDM